MPAKGKEKSKTYKDPKTGRKRTVSYGQAGKAKGGGPRVRPNSPKGDAYCARSYAHLKKHQNAARNPNSPLRLSRRDGSVKEKRVLDR